MSCYPAQFSGVLESSCGNQYILCGTNDSRWRSEQSESYCPLLLLLLKDHTSKFSSTDLQINPWTAQPAGSHVTLPLQHWCDFIWFVRRCKLILQRKSQNKGWKGKDKLAEDEDEDMFFILLSCLSSFRDYWQWHFLKFQGWTGSENLLLVIRRLAGMSRRSMQPEMIIVIGFFEPQIRSDPVSCQLLNLQDFSALERPAGGDEAPSSLLQTLFTDKL